MSYYYKTACTVIVVAIILFSACTPRLQKPVQKIAIITEKNVRIVSVDRAMPASIVHKPALSRQDLQSLDTKQLYKNVKRIYKAENRATRDAGKALKFYYVPRDSTQLAITLRIDSTQKIFYLKPYKNYGRFLNMRYVFRTKDSLHLLDHKRWMYPRKNVITIRDTGISITRFVPAKKNSVSLTMSPGVQLFNLKTDSGRYHSGGIVGLQMGVDFHYRENRFISFNVGAATDAIPLPIDYFGVGYIERGSTVYTSVRNNIVKGNFDIGYGIGFARMYWTNFPYGDSSLLEQKARTTSLSMSFSANYKIKQNLRVGVLYQPNLVSINSAAPSGYQHYMAFHITLSFGKREHSR